LPAAAHCSQTALGEHEGAWLRLAWPSGADVGPLCSRGSTATISAASMSVPAHSAGATFVSCPAGRPVTGGGIGTPDTPVNDYLQVSGPQDETGLRRTRSTVTSGSAGTAACSTPAGSPQHKVFALCAFRPTL
jgi:hypothetical protein